MRFVCLSPPSRKAKRFLVDDQGQDKLRFLSVRFLNIDRLLTVVALKHCQLNSDYLVLRPPSYI